MILRQRISIASSRAFRLIVSCIVPAMLLLGEARCSSSTSTSSDVAGDGGAADDGATADVQNGDPVAADGESPKPSDAGVVVLPLGTATSTPLSSCATDSSDAGPRPGASCTSVTVTCGGIASDTAIVAVSEPTGTPVGTVLLMSGGGGTKYFNIPESTSFLAANLRVVEIAWTSDWPSGQPASALNSACRAATLSQWIYDNVHGGAAASKTAGFCGLGISGGGAFFAYSMAHYGLKNIYDYLQIESGPSVSKFDFGCDPSLYDGGPRDLCPQIPNAAFAFTPPTNGQIDGMEGTHTCGADGGAAPADIVKWTADGIVSPGADYNYPQTAMSFWFCGGTDQNESSGLGSFLVEKVRPMGEPPPVNCFTDCTGENVLGDPAAQTATVSQMIAGCVPNHK
jgi:hypothetical protein